MDVILEDEEDDETEAETTPKGKRGKPKLKQVRGSTTRQEIVVQFSSKDYHICKKAGSLSNAIHFGAELSEFSFSFCMYLGSVEYHLKRSKKFTAVHA